MSTKLPHNKLQTENKRSVDKELDIFERKLGELRVLYEQHFVDVLPFPPDEQHKEIKRMIRNLLHAPFKNSANKFRMRTLLSRYQTYSTYWERVNKQREEGTYVKDQFKAEMREKMADSARRDNSAAGRADKGFQQLFSTYQDALKKSGGKTDNLNFDAFKQSLIAQARELKKTQGVTKLKYKVVNQNGKVIVKASSGG
ncbi:MAG: hypothetical protein PHC51_09750 [bacterium]|nr:hypothetical protein [bacterium]